jgi:hypothetical protein
MGLLVTEPASVATRYRIRVQRERQQIFLTALLGVTSFVLLIAFAFVWLRVLE